jgi:hypothetical protein
MSLLECNRNVILKKVVNELFPLVYKGLESIYEEASNVSKENPKAILKNFQLFLKKIPEWEAEMLEKEKQRLVMNTSNLEELLKCYVKLSVVQLTGYTESSVINFASVSELNLSNFVHDIYKQIARELYSNPMLMYDKVAAVEYKKNQMLILDIVKNVVNNSVLNLLPWEEITTRILMLDEKDMLNKQMKYVNGLMTGGNMEDEENEKSLEKKTPEKKTSEKKTTENILDKMITPSKLPKDSDTTSNQVGGDMPKINRSDLNEKDKKILDIIDNLDKSTASVKNEKSEKRSEKKSEKDSGTSIKEKVVELNGGGNVKNEGSDLKNVLNELNDSESVVSHVPASEDGYSGYADVFTNKNINTEEKTKKLSKNKYFANYLKV